MTKHTRHDLNLAHLVARSGINKDFNPDFLTQANKNDWLPMHLSKNRYIAQILLKKSQPLIDIKDLIIPCIKNYAQSSQTKYGTDLEYFLIEQGFSSIEASLAKNPPSDLERIDLGSYYFSFIEESWFKDFNFNPVDLAISHCNSAFFFALQKSNLPQFIHFFKPSANIKIGSNFYVNNQAFQIKQQFKQFWNLNLLIIEEPSYNFHLKSSDHLMNLEGA